MTPKARSTAGILVLLAGLAGSIAGPAVAPLAAQGSASSTVSATTRATDGQGFTFQQLNREWTNEVTEAAPVTQGGVTIHVTSPSNRVRIHRHSLHLTPLSDGTHRFRLTAAFDGEGELQARLETGIGGGTELEDQIVIPLQDTELEGRVRVRSAPEGYLFTALELPPRAVVTIDSQLAGRFVKICDVLAGPFLPMDCGALRTGLSRVVIPMPAAGETYLLPRSFLSADEQATFEAFLGDPGEER